VLARHTATLASNDGQQDEGQQDDGQPTGPTNGDETEMRFGWGGSCRHR